MSKEVLAEKKILFNIYGMDIKSDTVYQITPRVDNNAPQAFIDAGTTKVLSLEVDNAVPGAIFDEQKNAWDTGMYLESRALTKAFPSEAERKKVLLTIKKNITEPIEALKGAGVLSHIATKEQNKFWDEYRITVKKDKIFSTNKPEDILNIFLIILHRQVKPSHVPSGNPEFSKAQYSIQDKDSVVDRQQQVEMDQMEASGIFYNLLKTNKKDLSVVLEYLSLSASEKSDNSALTAIFNRFIKDKQDGIQNTKLFLKTAEKLSTEDGETELYLFDKLRKLTLKGRVKQKKGQIWFNDEFIGDSFKDAALRAMSNKELQKEILETE